VRVWEALAPLANPLSLVATNPGNPLGEGTVQLVRRVGSESIAVGPPLVSFQWSSGTSPFVANGPGVVWLYEGGSSTPPTVWRISRSSGMVLQKTRVPFLSEPLLAADANGLYFAGGGAGDVDTTAQGLILHVGIGASSANTVLANGRIPNLDAEFAGSLIARAGVIVASVCTRATRPISCHVKQIAEHP
jgi:hypothetical protein